MPRVVLLGPQRWEPTVGEVVADLGLAGPFALITAGWQEREPEDDELRAAIGGTAVNLGLYALAEQLMQGDRELDLMLKERQNKLRELQDLYRLRLAAATQAARKLLAMKGDEALIGPERESALEALRSLDRHHLGRVTQIQREYDERVRLSEREAVARQREKIVQQIHDCEAVLIAGGHVAVLLNRMRIFGLEPVLHQKPVVAWAAGAMVASDRIVLFHDSPPQGPGNAEVLDRGFGLCHGVLPLPHASNRLRLDDPARVALFARRFFDLRPVALDARMRLDWRPPRWQPHPGILQLESDGSLRAWEAR
jgi:hypothetical protein